MDQAMESDGRRDMDEQALEHTLVLHATKKVCDSDTTSTYLVTLSRLWNTSEFLHMAIATALFPYARQ